MNHKNSRYTIFCPGDELAAVYRDEESDEFQIVIKATDGVTIGLDEKASKMMVDLVLNQTLKALKKPEALNIFFEELDKQIAKLGES